jgi:uncharacterized protein YndB with AHSA1/START domain
MLTREIGKLTVAAVGDHEVVMTREFQAPRPLVYKAFTTPERVKHWLVRRVR